MLCWSIESKYHQSLPALVWAQQAIKLRAQVIEKLSLHSSIIQMNKKGTFKDLNRKVWWLLLESCEKAFSFQATTSSGRPKQKVLSKVKIEVASCRWSNQTDVEIRKARTISKERAYEEREGQEGGRGGKWEGGRVGKSSVGRGKSLYSDAETLRTLEVGEKTTWTLIDLLQPLSRILSLPLSLTSPSPLSSTVVSLSLSFPFSLKASRKAKSYFSLLKELQHKNLQPTKAKNPQVIQMFNIQ